MDAVKYLREFARMCAEYSICKGCPIGDRECRIMEAQEPEEIVTIVEKWAKEHPERTRQSVFLERYPNAKTGEDGSIGICPAVIEGKNCNELSDGTSCCKECRSNYWGQEAHDE